MPTSISPASDKIKVGQIQTLNLWGYFCSLNCAKRHGLDLPCAKKRREVMSLFTLMTSRNYGRQVVAAAPRRHHLKIYGGKLKPEEFKEASFLQRDASREGGKENRPRTGKEIGTEMAINKWAARPKFRLSRVVSQFGVEIYLPAVHKGSA